MDRETAKKIIDKFGGIENTIKIVKDCPKDCQWYVEKVGDTVAYQIPIGSIMIALTIFGVDINANTQEQ